MKTQKQILSVFVFPFALAACSPGKLDVTKQLSKDIENGSACTDFHEKINTTLTQALLDGESLPSSAELRVTLETDLPDSLAKLNLIEKVIEAYELITIETRDVLGLQTEQELIAAMMGLEIGDETTPEKKALKTKLQKSLKTVFAQSLDAGLACAPVVPTEPVAEPVVSEPETVPPEDTKGKITSLPVEGAVRVLATAYQSCQSARLPAMTSSTGSLHSKAIKITGTHSNGVGLKREVGDLKLLQQTHFYIREGTEKDSSCFDVPKNPLIYDYGGKPYSTSAESSSLDLFRNAGTGTSVLGIDCSGYIFSALAVNGLRLSPGKKLKAFQVNGVNARMYMEPASNGLSCLAPVPSTKTAPLQDGDILASTGHIVMIDRVGNDPFGIQRLRSVSDCKSANISTTNFDFDVLHSAPIKNGIGLNRSRASYYLGQGGSMKTGMIEYAVAACKARFGQASTVKPSSARLVRHKLTSDCRDTPVRLERESCVRSCLAGI